MICEYWNRSVKTDIAKETEEQYLGFAGNTRRQCKVQSWQCSLKPPAIGNSWLKASAATIWYPLLNLKQSHASKSFSRRGPSMVEMLRRWGLSWTFTWGLPCGFVGLVLDCMAVSRVSSQPFLPLSFVWSQRLALLVALPVSPGDLPDFSQ